MKTNRSFGTLQLTQLAMLVAITILVAFYGAIMLPGGLKITFATVPVAVGAIVLGPVGGLVCGLTFGLCSIYQGLTGMSALTSALISYNLIGGFIMTVAARALDGYLTALIFRALRTVVLPAAADRAQASSKGRNILPFLGASLSCPILNTVFFMGTLVLFFWNTERVQSIAAGLGTTNPLLFIILLVGVQGLIEALVCALVGTAVSRILYGYVQRNTFRRAQSA